MFSAVANRVYGIQLVLAGNNAAAAARDALVDIGIDEAGGSSYTGKIPDLICTGAVNNDKGGISFYFPLGIKAGSTIAARASVNNATVGTIYVWATLFGLPRNPESCRVGSFVEAIGVVSATSKGTDVTSGSTSEGAWTSLGSTANPCWWWQQGMGLNNSNTGARVYALDLGVGDGSNKDVVIQDQTWGSDTSERLVNTMQLLGCERHVPAGTNVYGRIQCSGTPDSGSSMVAYALGG